MNILLHDIKQQYLCSYSHIKLYNKLLNCGETLSDDKNKIIRVKKFLVERYNKPKRPEIEPAQLTVVMYKTNSIYFVTSSSKFLEHKSLWHQKENKRCHTQSSETFLVKLKTKTELITKTSSSPPLDPLAADLFWARRRVSTLLSAMQ